MLRSEFNHILANILKGATLTTLSPLEGIVNKLGAQTNPPDYIEVAQINHQTGEFVLPPTMVKDGFGIETIGTGKSSYTTLNIPTIGADFPHKSNAKNQLLDFQNYDLPPEVVISRISYNTLNQSANILLSNGQHFDISITEFSTPFENSDVYVHLDHEQYAKSALQLFSPVERDIGIRRHVLGLEEEQPDYRMDIKDGVIRLTQMLSWIPVSKSITREYSLKLPENVSAEILLGKYLKLETNDQYKFGVADNEIKLPHRTNYLLAYPDFKELKKGSLKVHYLNFISSQEHSFSFHETSRTFQEMIDEQMNVYIGRDQARHNRTWLKKTLKDHEGKEYEAVFRVGKNGNGDYHFSDGLRSVVADEPMTHFNLGKGWPDGSKVIQSHNLTDHGYIVVESEDNQYLVQFRPFNKAPQRAFSTYELIKKNGKVTRFNRISSE